MGAFRVRGEPRRRDAARILDVVVSPREIEGQIGGAMRDSSESDCVNHAACVGNQWRTCQCQDDDDVVFVVERGRNPGIILGIVEYLCFPTRWDEDHFEGFPMIVEAVIASGRADPGNATVSGEMSPVWKIPHLQALSRSRVSARLSCARSTKHGTSSMSTFSQYFSRDLLNASRAARVPGMRVIENVGHEECHAFPPFSSSQKRCSWAYIVNIIKKIEWKTQCHKKKPKECECNEDYKEEKGRCMPENGAGLDDSCDPSLHNCYSEHAECIGEPGSATCKCTLDYVRDEDLCMESRTGRTDAALAICTPDNSECAGDSGSETCRCKEGFTEDDGKCRLLYLGELCNEWHEFVAPNSHCFQDDGGLSTCQCLPDYVQEQDRCSEFSQATEGVRQFYNSAFSSSSLAIIYRNKAARLSYSGVQHSLPLAVQRSQRPYAHLLAVHH
ncbi:unnamed protein product [Darwinula stevensoni]|uniref:Uncharacterized protein n=1 Tax=Darwinula stevensoni TaxID=69355 RepID=A0A7R9ABA0_9CRUS|nr:unnamed protein product [Darwinula stevensoni]CAG0898844.1 unnamed protein product [Darwinula stevensoni]